jgi:hypothetical protein
MLNITIHIIYFIFSLSSEKVLNETQKDWLQPVATGLRQLRDFLKMTQPATGNFKNQRNRNRWSGPLWSGCVRLPVFLRSIGLDLQTLLGTIPYAEDNGMGTIGNMNNRSQMSCAVKDNRLQSESCE